MMLFPYQMKCSYTTVVVSNKISRLVLIFVSPPRFFLAAHTGLMNLIHYWNSITTILLGEVCHWTKIVIVYADKKLGVKLGTLSVQSI